jgi:hypothetical protein
MTKLWRVLTSGVLLAVFAMSAAADESPLPTPLELHYVLHYGDLTVGRVTKTLTRESDGTYIARSRSQPAGMARWFTSVEWFEEGRFEVVQDQVRPLSFLEYRVGADKSHRHSATFDWKTMQIHYSRGPVVPLPPDTQDQGSLLYAFMLHPPTPGSEQTIHISGGKKLNRYRYAETGSETLKTVLGTLQTRIIERRALKEGDEVFRIWLAPTRGNLPVRIQTIKRGQPTTLDLESISNTPPASSVP